ncbi:uracil-DNA glycosylase [Nematocida parisii]|uniref:Uracil-DNA glycosylase n=1 Tax=Nematocida parisii (strain ERTm3) TaxID=935791 RepID=I3EH90_NEMP3|nr:uracil-DNA glycosylase [Nematocida parisii ERTm1]EIJ88587.1 uracil-DNA glycosylase [Nematocida parisii ERTm3]KAI5145310.1 uracil-DNA glycosylase [Nematocida parisii]EIJ94837.1 uracil-DNA glycosylase [Nematocida parisii ERTm1]KAI5154219.1 uracil-DNA glycosylase [Nematocida parisii]KAI5157839.1 uracil-DNA glycosylase [Nematocida parisii]|eukprot:XP_013058193.1 uracil-DNA glycosylase [Nematocida parisii ERTm1]
MCTSTCAICKLHEEVLPGWMTHINQEFSKEYFKRILDHLHTVQFYPKPEHILRCLTYTECTDIKVVILGQDPYHGHNQAEGLSFSVGDGVRVPPSLANIKKEIFNSIGVNSVCSKGSLIKWAEQGVLLLNTILTVTRNKPRSHSSIGWVRFTDEIIRIINDTSEGVVFMLWGKDAQKKKLLIDGGRHFILCAPHPSPFSARTGFFGCDHFKKSNDYLVSCGKDPIKW